MVVHGVLTETLSVYVGVRPGVAVERLDDMDGDTQALHAPHHHRQAQRIPVIDEWVPVATDAGLASQPERPLWVAAGARFDINAGGLRGLNE